MYLLAHAGCIADASGPGSPCARLQRYRQTAWPHGNRQRCQRLSPTAVSVDRLTSQVTRNEMD